MLYNSAKTACLGKIWFFGYGLKLLSTNQIAVFFDEHQYLWKELVNTVDFMHVSNHRKKAGHETTIFDLM